MPAADPLATLRPRLSSALREAMKARDTVATSALRSLLSALDHATAVPMPDGLPAVPDPDAPAIGEVPRRALTDADVAAVVAAEIDARMRAEAELRRLGRPDEAARAAAERAVIEPWRRSRS